MTRTCGASWNFTERRAVSLPFSSIPMTHPYDSGAVVTDENGAVTRWITRGEERPGLQREPQVNGRDSSDLSEAAGSAAARSACPSPAGNMYLPAQTWTVIF